MSIVIKTVRTERGHGLDTVRVTRVEHMMPYEDLPKEYTNAPPAVWSQQDNNGYVLLFPEGIMYFQKGEEYPAENYYNLADKYIPEAIHRLHKILDYVKK